MFAHSTHTHTHLQLLWPARCPRCLPDQSTCSRVEPSQRHSDSSCCCCTPETVRNKLSQSEQSAAGDGVDDLTHSTMVTPVATVVHLECRCVRALLVETGLKHRHMRSVQSDLRFASRRRYYAPFQDHKWCPGRRRPGQRRHRPGGRRFLCRPGWCG